jgi:protein phosphatase
MLKPVELSARSDVGRVRAHNEDRYLAAPPLLAVADGMGGAQAGEVAAGVAVEHLEGLGPEPSPDALRAAIVEANEAIRRMAAEDPERAGMGTTVTAALLGDGGRLELMHVGDSRAYLLRGDRLERLTRDHSLVADMIERGSLTEEEAGSTPSATSSPGRSARSRRSTSSTPASPSSPATWSSSAPTASAGTSPTRRSAGR